MARFKTISLNDDVYYEVLQIKTDLMNKTKKSISFSDVVKQMIDAYKEKNSEVK